jgi:ubiquinone/menaquinone biosynthesis C-methylase UbiE
MRKTHMNQLIPRTQKNPNPQGKGNVTVLQDWDALRPRSLERKSANNILTDYCLSALVLAAKFQFRPVQGAINDINVPAESVDLILLVDAYHEFSHPREMGESMFRALKPGGRIALVEYRAEDPSVPIKPLHKMSEAQAIREMSALGLRWMETRDSLPQQHLMFFAKPATDASVRES